MVEIAMRRGGEFFFWFQIFKIYTGRVRFLGKNTSSERWQPKMLIFNLF